ncbi:hypothetical protein F5X98DRAFT_375070 [Xylaria grammica]|nr:hypothetical protein F5X98DRAFT_375070 [Xylaria grammica]
MNRVISAKQLNRRKESQRVDRMRNILKKLHTIKTKLKIRHEAADITVGIITDLTLTPLDLSRVLEKTAHFRTNIRWSTDQIEDLETAIKGNADYISNSYNQIDISYAANPLTNLVSDEMYRQNYLRSLKIDLKYDIRKPDSAGTTPLYTIAYQNNGDLVRLFIGGGANVDARRNRSTNNGYHIF